MKVKAEEGQFIFTTQEVLALFDIGDSTLKRWVKEGCPKLGRDQWDLQQLLRWRGLGKRGDNQFHDSPEAKKLQAEADLKDAKARQEEVRLQEMLGYLVPIEMVQEQLADTFTEIRQTMLRLPNDVRARIHVQYPDCSEGVSEIVNTTVRKCLESLAECNNATTTRKVVDVDSREDSDSEETI